MKRFFWALLLVAGMARADCPSVGTLKYEIDVNHQIVYVTPSSEGLWRGVAAGSWESAELKIFWTTRIDSVVPSIHPESFLKVSSIDQQTCGGKNYAFTRMNFSAAGIQRLKESMLSGQRLRVFGWAGRSTGPANVICGGTDYSRAELTISSVGSCDGIRGRRTVRLTAQEDNIATAYPGLHVIAIESRTVKVGDVFDMFVTFLPGVRPTYLSYFQGLFEYDDTKLQWMGAYDVWGTGGLVNPAPCSPLPCTNPPVCDIIPVCSAFAANKTFLVQSFYSQPPVPNSSNPIPIWIVHMKALASCKTMVKFYCFPTVISGSQCRGRSSWFIGLINPFAELTYGSADLAIQHACVTINDANGQCTGVHCNERCEGSVLLFSHEKCPPHCIVEQPPATPAVILGPPAPMGDAVWAVMKKDCRWCHLFAPFPAGIDLTSRTSVRTDQMQLMWEGVAQEKAPAIQRLNQADKDSVLRWAVQNGAVSRNLIVPQTFDWVETTQIGNIPDGASAVSPGHFFGFAVEDSWVFGANVNGASPATVATYTDRDGLALKGVSLNMTHAVSVDSFPGSTKPSSYIIPNGIPFHGRFKSMTFSGYMRFEHHTSIVVHQFDDRPLGRDHRYYVRFELDKEWASIHTTPMEQEVYPWITSNACPTDGRLTGVLDKIDLSLYDDKWYYVTGAVALVAPADPASQISYRFTVRPSPGGTVIADLLGYSAADTKGVGGIAFHHYGPTTTGKPSMWAGFEVHVTYTVGAGGAPKQACKTCDLEAP